MTITLNEQNKFVTLRMAAEAFLVDSVGNVASDADLIRALKIGNKHARKFSPADAEYFAAARARQDTSVFDKFALNRRAR